MLDIKQILDIIPHRYPLLLVDRVLEIGHDEIIGIKNVTFNEPFFAGHFPGNPIMPGVLIIEAMAQLSAILSLHDIAHMQRKIAYLLSIENAKFRKQVTPGDCLLMKSQRTQRRNNVCRYRAYAQVNDDLVAEVELTAMLNDYVPQEK